MFLTQSQRPRRECVRRRQSKWVKVAVWPKAGWNQCPVTPGSATARLFVYGSTCGRPASVRLHVGLICSFWLAVNTILHFLATIAFLYVFLLSQCWPLTSPHISLWELYNMSSQRVKEDRKLWRGGLHVLTRSVAQIWIPHQELYILLNKSNSVTNRPCFFLSSLIVQINIADAVSITV